MPLGSGPYRIKEFVAGRSVVLERVKDYWGDKLPVTGRPEQFRRNALRIFPRQYGGAGSLQGRPGRLDRRERAPSNGRRPTIFRRSREKRVVKEEFPINNSGRMQGFAFNLRRDSSRTRGCAAPSTIAYDFEEMNKQLFYGQYKRINSYFDGTELASSGLPQGQELQILETVRDKVPAEVFTTPYTNPVGGNPEAVRANLRESDAAAEGSRLRGPRPQAGRSRGQAGQRRDSWSRIRLDRAHRAVLQAVAGTHRRHRVDPHRRRRAISKPAAQFRFRHHHRACGASRCRPATSSANSGARRPPISPGSQQHHRHQESRGRCADRRSDLRQGSRRTGGGRPRRSIACCCGISMSCRNSPTASRAMRAGIASAMPSRCRNTAVPDCRRCGGGTPKRPPRSASDLEGFFAHGAALPPARARSRRRRAERGAVSAGDWRPRPAPRCTACRCSAT